MGPAVIACADVATAKTKPATAINLIIRFLRLYSASKKPATAQWSIRFAFRFARTVNPNFASPLLVPWRFRALSGAGRGPGQRDSGQKNPQI
jgi:hypothetical protein